MRFTPGTFQTARQRLGLNQIELASLVGVGPDTIAAIEDGIVTPGPDLLLVMVLYLHEDLGYFTGEHAPRESVAA